MRTLDASRILALWEAMPSLHPIDQALSVLASAYPDLAHGELAGLSIGERDRRLLELHASTFGPTLEGYATCPSCSAATEYSIVIEELLASALRRATDPFASPAAEWFRLPNSFDLAEMVSYGSADEGRRSLASRLRVGEPDLAERANAEDSDSEVTEALVEAIVAADPMCDSTLELICPDCGQEWQVIFDPVPFFMEQISQNAQRLLFEIHSLASAYGWAEWDVLAMSSRRRSSYLRLLGL